MQEFLKDYGQLMGVILAVIYVVFFFDFSGITDQIKSVFTRLTARPGSVTQPTGMTSSQRSLDEQEYSAAIMLAERAKRRKCPECDQAIRTYLAHWLDDNMPVEG